MHDSLHLLIGFIIQFLVFRIKSYWVLDARITISDFCIWENVMFLGKASQMQTNVTVINLMSVYNSVTG